MQKQTNLLKFMALLAIAIGFAACGGTDGATGNTPGTGDNNLNLTVNDAAASESLAPPAGKALGSESEEITVAKAAVSSGSVRCISRDSSGNKTTVTGTLDEKGVASLQGVPSNQATICYLLNSSGAVTATFTVSDTGAVGGIRDGFNISGGKTTSATITYNSTTKNATSDCTGTDCQAPTSGGDTAVDLTGTWKMNCVGIRREDNDALDSSQTCPSDLNNQNVHLHRVSAKDADGVVRYGYGAWPSLAAFEKCGSTEGLQNLPTGWSVTTSGQTGDFTWNAPFAAFTSASTSAQISTMIRNVTSGPAQSFSTYQTANCTGRTANQCAGEYFWAQIYSYIAQNPAAQCWPNIKMSWDADDNPTFLSRSGFGGTTQPNNRYDFMATYQIGEQIYMKSFFSETIPAYDQANSKRVDCVYRSELLVSFVSPPAVPVAGDQVSVKFTNTTSVTATSGTSADNTVCRADVGSNTEWSTKGTYIDVTMTKQ